MEAFKISASDIEDRIDATYYLPENRKIVTALHESDFETEDLSALAERVFNPSRLTRNYTDKDIQYIDYDPDSAGKPFINVSEARKWPEVRIIHKIGEDRSVDDYHFTNEDWLLVTRSGTVGMTMKVNEMTGLIGCEHFLRIVPGDTQVGDLLYAYLNSTYGIPQAERGSHGSVVEELRPENLENIVFPRFSETATAQVAELVSDAMESRREALAKLKDAHAIFDDRIPLESADISEKSTFKITSSDIEDRLDATYYLPENRQIIDAIHESGYDTTTVHEETVDIFHPGWFTRNYVEEEQPFFNHHEGKEGVPYLKPSKAMELPETRRIDYVSESMDDLEDYLLEEGTIMVTRSGTVGVPIMVTDEFAGCAASEHLIRAIPEDREFGRYLYAFLLHRMGRMQVKMGTHGSVVQEITDDHVGSPIVPLLDEPDIEKVIELTDAAIEKRQTATQKIRDAINFIESELPDLSEGVN
jgi:type I restriction enzyme S subunit